MAQDHFQKHDTFQGKVDWNFNLIFDDQPQVAELTKEFGQLIDHPGLYPPVPTKWLHATVLRAGVVSEFTEEEMLAVVMLLKSSLSEVEFPEFMLGHWWLWGGNVVLHIAPEDPLQKLFSLVVKTMESVVGKDRMPTPDKFIPHITLAYCRAYNEELEVYKQLSAKLIRPVSFKVTSMPLIKQSAVYGHYEWEVIDNIPLGKID